MTQATSTGSRARALLRSRLGVRFSRYTGASVVAVLVSWLVFSLAYGPLGTSSGIALVSGFVAGLIPKYMLCRNWAWRRRGRSKIGREVLPYVAVSVSGAVFTYYLTEFLEDYVRSISDGGLQVFLMGIAFVASQGLFFVLKFVLFDRLVFSDRSRPPAGPPAGHHPPEPAES